MLIFETISYDPLQFGTLIQIILFIVFMWMSYETETMVTEENKKSYAWHFNALPYIKGFWYMLGGLTFIGLSFSIDSYLPFITGAFLKGIGVLMTLLGGVKMFYYQE